MCPKLQSSMKEQRVATIEQIKMASKEEQLNKITKRKKGWHNGPVSDGNN